MPRYTYQCDQCDYREERLEPKTVLEIPCLMCEGTMHRRFPIPYLSGTNRAVNHRYAAVGKTIGQQFAKYPQQLALLRARAKARGIDFSTEDAYDTALAKHVLDPEAIIPHDDPRGHIKRISMMRGDPCEGMVEVQAVQKDPVPDTGPNLSDHAIRGIMVQKLCENPDIRHNRAAVRKLREDVINQHAPKQLVGDL